LAAAALAAAVSPRQGAGAASAAATSAARNGRGNICGGKSASLYLVATFAFRTRTAKCSAAPARALA